MQYSISAFFLKEVSDMDVYEKLEELRMVEERTRPN